jgi:hypothetical protein
VSAYDYDGLKRLAKDLGVKIPALLALSYQNDPFYAGIPARKAAAEWFAELWRRFDFQRGIHLSITPWFRNATRSRSQMASHMRTRKTVGGISLGPRGTRATLG